MAKTIDFTDLPVGTKVMWGIIEKCPHCRKNGFADRRDENTLRYIHVIEPGNLYELELCPRSTKRISGALSAKCGQRSVKKADGGIILRWPEVAREGPCVRSVARQTTVKSGVSVRAY